VLRANAPPRLHWQYRPRPDLTHATIYRGEAPRVLRDLFPPAQWITSITSPPEQIAAMTAERVTPLEHGTEVTREPAGAFVLLREEYRSEHRAAHVADRWTKIHLSFDAPDRRVNVSLTDDGASLSANAHSPGCSVWVNYLPYGYGGDERHLFDAMRTSLRVLVDRCGSSMADPDQYGRLLEAAEADFPGAMQAMKAGVAAAFGPRTERCNPPDPDAMPGLHRGPCGYE
jgi:hypothetical protein